MKKRISMLAAALLVTLSLAVTLISCGGDDDDPTPDKPKATSIELVSGGDQSAFTEATLENAVVVIVKDQNGDAFAGANLTFAVTEGSVSAASSTTDANGNASVNWTLWTTEGTQTLTVSGVGTPLTVNATGLYEPTIGDYKYGGVIFYIDQTGLHGLVCAVKDQTTSTEWGCYETLFALG